MKPQAVRISEQVIEVHSRSFALAAKLLPPRVHDRAVVLYAWCRRADDAVDLSSAEHGRLAVDRLHRELDSIYAGAPQSDPLLEAFQLVVEENSIPQAYPRELVHGLEMDLDAVHYRTLDDLLLYCYRVAGVVGLMMCHVMRLKDPQATRNAVHLGMAMQMTNIARDVAADWDIGRLYLPDPMLERNGASGLREHLGGPFPIEFRHAVAAAIQELLDEADLYYRSGDEGMRALTWQCALAIRTARRVYSAIGDRLQDVGCDPLSGRAYVSRERKVALTGRSFLASAGEAPSRLAEQIGIQVRAGGSRAGIPDAHVRFPQDILPLESRR